MRLETSATGERTGVRVAIIGAGPAGLTAARHLVLQGFEVHVFDKMPEPGGLLVFGIPSWRAPKDRIRARARELERYGVVFNLSTIVLTEHYKSCAADEISAKTTSLRDILNKFEIVIIASGAWRAKRLNVRGEDLRGVHAAIDFIVWSRLHELGYVERAPEVGRRVAVVGAGRTAVDVIHELLRRHDVESIHLIYRRSIEEAPASEELKRLIESSRKLVVHEHRTVSEIRGRNCVSSVVTVRLQRIEGKLVVVPGTEEELHVDAVIEAVGEEPTPPFTRDYEGIRLRRDGRIDVDDRYRTTRRGVFAVGDVAHGPSTVAQAVRSGVEVVKSVNDYVRRGVWREI